MYNFLHHSLVFVNSIGEGRSLSYHSATLPPSLNFLFHQPLSAPSVLVSSFLHHQYLGITRDLILLLRAAAC